LENRLVPVIEKHYEGGNFTFQQDNAPAHTAKSVWSHSCSLFSIPHQIVRPPDAGQKLAGREGLQGP
jgi:hypothetical protein